jgi:hypothetical protein
MPSRCLLRAGIASIEPESAETKASTRRPSKRPRSQVGSCTKRLPAAFPFACWVLSVEQRRSNKLARRARVCRATFFRNRSPSAYVGFGLNYCTKALWLPFESQQQRKGHPRPPGPTVLEIVISYVFFEYAIRDKLVTLHREEADLEIGNEGAVLEGFSCETQVCGNILSPLNQAFPRYLSRG